LHRLARAMEGKPKRGKVVVLKPLKRLGDDGERTLRLTHETHDPLTVKQYASKYKMSYGRALRLCRDKLIPCIKVGRIYSIHPNATRM
jgi:hypothetical protein